MKHPLLRTYDLDIKDGLEMHSLWTSISMNTYTSDLTTVISSI